MPEPKTTTSAPSNSRARTPGGSKLDYRSGRKCKEMLQGHLQREKGRRTWVPVEMGPLGSELASLP